VFDPRLPIPESDAAERIDELCGGRARDGEEGTQADHDQRAARTDGQPRRDRGLDDQARDAGYASHRQRLDGSIRETIPVLQYAIKWKNAYYGVPELGWIIEMAAYAVSVNVSFFGGAEFDPPPPLGTTDRSRYVKLTTLEEAQGPEMHKWIEQAGRVPGWK
jgi:hypothetical protein